MVDFDLLYCGSYNNDEIFDGEVEGGTGMSSNMKDVEFTDVAKEYMLEALADEYFLDRDATIIYKTLEKNLKLISFGNYLKRYIYEKAGIKKAFEEVTIKEYQEIIKFSFEDTYTPCSFDNTTAKLSALSKNWLTQQSVNRKIVFILGFGLRMKVEDVNEFLQKALHEQGINAKDPFEVICWYCYTNRFGYYKYEELWGKYQSMNETRNSIPQVNYEETIGARNSLARVKDDEGLLGFLQKYNPREKQFSVTARKKFEELYNVAKGTVAAILNDTEESEHIGEIEKYRMSLMSSRLSSDEISKKIEGKLTRIRKHSMDSVSGADFEKILYSAVPMDKNGNMVPGRYSRLNNQFMGKRFSRQHIDDLISAKIEINRFDLISLNFLIYSQMEYETSKERYERFVESTNDILHDCYMSNLYVANPYECFILMCIISESPLSTYGDVWDLSFGNEV